VLIAGLIISLIALAYGFSRSLPQSGMGKAGADFGGPCRTIGGFGGGTEDIVYDAPSGRLYVSATDRRWRQNGREPGRGGIYTLALGDGAADDAPIDATQGAPANFRPHGMDLWTGADGRQRLFVVNHPIGEPSRIDIFDVEPTGLLTLSADGGAYDLLHRPNDVAADGPSSFYATNDHWARGRTVDQPGSLLEQIEVLFALDLGYVVRVANGAASKAATGLSFANGIALSADGTQVFVAEALDGVVRAYDRAGDGALKLAKRWKVGPGPDNLSRAADGALWIGAHDNLLAFTGHAADPAKLSPGSARRLHPATGVVVTAFSTKGGEMSAISTALSLPDGIALGSVFAPEIKICASGEQS